jgi:hypothetical protein
MALSDLSALVSATTQNLSQLKAFAAIYHLLQGGTPSISGLTTLIDTNNVTNFGSKTPTDTGPIFNTENVFINIANALFQGNPSAKAAFNALVPGIALSDKLASAYNALVDPSQQTDAGRNAFSAQAAFYSQRAVELGIPGDEGGAVVGFGALLNILVRDNNVGIGNSVNDLVQAINDGSAALPETSTTFTPIETADGTKFDSDDAGSPAAGVIINLLTATDTVSPTSPYPVFRSTAGDDTINAKAGTFTSATTIDGGGGTDSVFAINQSIGTVSPILKAVEKVFVTQERNTATIDFSNSSDIKELWNKGTTGYVGFSGISLGAKVGVENSNSMRFIDFKDLDVTGLSDEFTLTLDNARIQPDVDTGIEKLNIEVLSDSYINLGSAVKEINVTGTGNLEILTNTPRLFDASGLNGSISGSVSSDEGVIFVGTRFADTVRLSTGGFVPGDIIVFNRSNTSTLLNMDTYKETNLANKDKFDVSEYKIESSKSKITIFANSPSDGFSFSGNAVATQDGTGFIYVDINSDGVFSSATDLVFDVVSTFYLDVTDFIF